MLLIKDLNFNSIYKDLKNYQKQQIFGRFLFAVSFQGVFIKETQDIELIERLKIAIVLEEMDQRNKQLMIER
ncbi:unnamed protein product [Paramecium primaurelia]|uniref:Uncharacterized protein n=1 Tax=Paramecium primaurelia TaxID=5886 RepID=A0A8S1KQE7_PARPR|nr:unnamed protein product [Paramecium primaurelia]